MNVTYIGLSNNIRLIAEILATKSAVFGFVKPGENRARAAHDTIRRHPMDFIVVAEALGAPMSGSLRVSHLLQTVEGLRALGVEQPIIGLAQPFTEKRIAEFLNVGGTLLLPLRPLDERFFTVSSAVLYSQIHAVQRVITVSRLFDAPLNEDKLLTKGPISREHGFYLDGEGTMFFCGVKLDPVIGKLATILVEADFKPVDTKTLVKEMGSTIDAVEDYMESLRIKIARILKELGHPSDFPIIDTVGQRGRKLNQEGIAYIRDLRQRAEDEFSNCGFSVQPGGRIMFVDGREFKSSYMRKTTMQLLLEARGNPMPLEAMCTQLGVAETNVRQFCFYLNQELAAFLKDTPYELTSPFIKPAWGSYRIVANNLKKPQAVGGDNTFDMFIRSLARENRPLIHFVR